MIAPRGRPASRPARRWSLVGLLVLVLALGTSGVGGESGAPRAAGVDRESLSGRRFRFSWSSGDVRAVNGIATLLPSGRIAGIRSPNETSWEIDAAGRLIFRHADGSVSTRFETSREVDGVLTFEGPFLLREGITHHLVALEGAGDAAAGPAGHRVTPERMARVRYSSQRIVYLDVGGEHAIRLADGRTRRVRLLAVRERKDSVIGLVREAVVTVSIGDREVELRCAPYVMPTEVDGLRIQADTTSARLAIPARVQLSVWDAAEPVVDTGRFRFPLPGYRLLSHGMQAYGEPVHLGHRDGDPVGQRFYHDYGVDLAGFEGRQKVRSAIEGVVVEVDRGEGDLAIRDERGFVLQYGHLDSILGGIRPGARVRSGEWVGILGRRGASGDFSHLHVGARLPDAAGRPGGVTRNLNLYPWLVAAYIAENGPGLHAVAGPHHAVLTGERVPFDGSSSLAPAGARLSWSWELPDGSLVRGPRAETVFEAPGCYSVALRIADGRGGEDVGFCRVRVYSRERPEDVVPTLFVTRHPAADLRVDQPVTLRIWPQGLPVEDLRIDFGDGSPSRVVVPRRSFVHAFRRPGLFVVAVTGVAGPLPVTERVPIVVR